MDFKISFKISAFPFELVCEKSGVKALSAHADAGELTVYVRYTYSDRPLELRGRVNVGDKAELVLLSHRIELYVNGELTDEEWPMGDRLFEMGDVIEPSAGVEVTEFSEIPPEMPCVISRFENAEGWRPGEDVFAGDCMPYLRDSEYHVLYLKDRHHHRSKWGLGAHQWEHISTKDFKSWSVHPTAVPITEPQEGSICTGSWIRNGGREYLYYTVRTDGKTPAPIRRSISADGYHFKKDLDFGFTISDRYDTASARDPKVVRDENGLFHMLITTKLVKENRGCLAHYVSCDMEKWEDAGEPVYISPDSHSPECPDHFEYGGRYYLVFSLSGRAHYMISDKPFEGFFMPEDPIIPCGTVPKCAPWGERLVFAGFKGIDGYAGTLTFKAARAKENGELIFEEI